MGVPQDDLLLMTRALKRGFADLKAIRKALDRQVSRSVTLIEALRLQPDQAEALGADATPPDPAADRPLLESLHQMLLEGEHLGPGEWEKFVGSLAGAEGRPEYGPLQVPGEFEGHTLQWELARRERGVVYRAKDPNGNDVAIKVFRPDVEVKSDLPRVGGLAYVVGPFADGEPLESRRISTRRAIEAVHKAAGQLRDRTHGALTPARIVLEKDDSVAIRGFEHARAVPLSSRARAYSGGDDVRAMGAILFDLLVGTPPAGGTSPRERNKDVDVEIDRIVAAALTGGYASTGDFADDLGRFLKGQPVTARKTSAATSAGRKVWIWIGVAAVAAAAVGIFLATRKDDKEDIVEPSPAVAKKAEPAPKLPPAPVTERHPRPKSEPIRPSKPLAPLTEKDERKLYEACVMAMVAGDTDRIVDVASEALARGSKKDWPLYHLAHAFTARDELDKALEYATRALEAAPANEEYRILRMETLAFRGEADKALVDLAALYKDRHADVNAQIVALGKQIKADASDGRTRLLRGMYYLHKRHYDPAKEDFTAAIAAGRRRALAWRARAAHGGGDRVGATSDAKAYLEAFPSDFATKEVKAFLAELGDK